MLAAVVLLLAGLFGMGGLVLLLGGEAPWLGLLLLLLAGLTGLYGVRALIARKTKKVDAKRSTRSWNVLLPGLLTAGFLAVIMVYFEIIYFKNRSHKKWMEDTHKAYEEWKKSQTERAPPSRTTKSKKWSTEYKK
jgi:hypothetical protein